MMKFDVATIMRRAWQLAKSGAKRFGGSAKEYLAAAIRMSWALWRKDNARPTRPVTYSLPVAEVVSDQVDDVVSVTSADLDAEVAVAQTVAVAQAVKTTGFLAKVATAAKRIASGIKGLFALKVEIELVGAHG